MRLLQSKRWLIRGSIASATLVAALFAACANNGPPRPTCNEVSDGGVPLPVPIDAYTALTTDAQPPTVYGMEPDPGPQCVDCTQAKDVEIMTIADFEDGFAPAWFNYGEPGVPIEPPQAGVGVTVDGGTGAAVPQPWWGLQVATLSGQPGGNRCGSKYALHMEGGRFTSWGGGYVTQHFIVRGDYMADYCKTGPDGVALAPNSAVNGIGLPPAFMTDRSESGLPTGCMFWASPVSGQPSLLGADVSGFDGVTFWARRGPTGQSTLRVSLVDNNTSETLALNVEREAYFDGGVKPDDAHARCRRVRGCCRGCTQLAHDEYIPQSPDGGTPARVQATNDKRCHLEGERLPHFRTGGTTGIQAFDPTIPLCGNEPIEGDASQERCWVDDPQRVWSSWNDDFDLCCPPTMAEEDPAVLNGDPRYGGNECVSYVFNYDFSSGYYCHNPDDPPLPEKNDNRCGEGFETAVVVDTEWKLYTIPWHELRRYTPNTPEIDPSGIWQIAFYFGNGYLDTYLDDVGFYRKRR